MNTTGITSRQFDYILALAESRGIDPGAEGRTNLHGISRAYASDFIDRIKAMPPVVRYASNDAAKARATGANLGIDGEIWD